MDDPELLRRYDEIIQSQLEKGMIEVVNEHTKKGKRRHNIPLHAVAKPNNNTTTVGVVYGASRNSKKSNKNLNKCLHREPFILEDVCGLLMRFRKKNKDCC